VTTVTSPAPLDDAWAAGYREGHAMALSAHDTAAVLLVAARAVVDWAEMAEGGNVAAEDAMFDRIDQLRAALNAQEADHD